MGVITWNYQFFKPLLRNIILNIGLSVPIRGRQVIPFCSILVPGDIFYTKFFRPKFVHVFIPFFSTPNFEI